MTAVRGTFADFKTVKTRGVCQLIIEVPIESADHALAVLGGVPQAKAEQWVGIAPVVAPDGDDKPADEQPVPEGTPPAQEPERVKGGARAKRAGIFMQTPTVECFTGTLGYRFDWRVDQPSRPLTDRDATIRHQICAHCQVRNFRELDHNEEAGRIWDGIEADYRASQRGETLAAREHQLAEGPG